MMTPPGCPTGRAGPIVRGGRLARVERTTGPRGVLDRQPALFVAVRRQARCCSGSHRRVPPDDEVLFFATACDVDGSGRVVPMPQVGADFSAGQMNVDRPEWTAPSATARAFRSGAHVGWDPRVVSRSAAAAPARAHRSPCRRRRRTPAGSSRTSAGTAWSNTRWPRIPRCSTHTGGRSAGWARSYSTPVSPTCATRWIPAHPARHRPGAGRVLAPSTSRPGSPVTDAAVRVRLPVPQRAPPRRGRPPGPGSGLAMIMRRGP